MRFSLNQSFSTCRLAVAGVSTTVELKSKKSQEKEGLWRGFLAGLRFGEDCLRV